MSSSWTSRFGMLIPSGNVVVERDVRLVMPEDVTVHFARMKLTVDSEEELARLATLAPEAADLVSDAVPRAIAFMCTTGSLNGGLGYDQSIIDRLSKQAGVPVTTTATAMIAALEQVQGRRVTLVSPYEPWLNDRVASFLRDHGIEVVESIGFAEPSAAGIRRIDPDAIAQAARETHSRGDVVFISCTGFRGVEAAALLVNEMPVPVLTSNQVSFWHVLKLVDQESILDRSPMAQIFGVLR